MFSSSGNLWWMLLLAASSLSLLRMKIAVALPVAITGFSKTPEVLSRRVRISQPKARCLENRYVGYMAQSRMKTVQNGIREDIRGPRYR